MPHILIVDDEPDARDVLGEVLTAHGYSVEYAANGWEAMLQVDRERFDLILLDIMMPGMDGARFLSLLRGYVARGTTPVVVVTALDAEEARSLIEPNQTHGIVEKKGADYYKELVERIQMIVGSGQHKEK